MAQAINTSFDQTVEQDVILEQLDGQAPAVQTTLKNAENVYKSFLYLRKMYSRFPAKSKVLVMNSINNASYEEVLIPESATEIMLNNHSDSNSGIKINGGEYIIRAGENITLPLIAPDSTIVPSVPGDILELNGILSYVIKNVQEY